MSSSNKIEESEEVKKKNDSNNDSNNDSDDSDDSDDNNDSNDNNDDDDNRQVSAADLEEQDQLSEAETTNMWDNKESVAKLQKAIDSLSQLRINKVLYPTEVMILATADALGRFEWMNYESFNNFKNRILSERGNPPFTVKTKDQHTNLYDFWIVRSFININDNPYTHNNVTYNKKDVLLSNQFNRCLVQYCKTILKDEVQFWIFTGTRTDNQKLSMSRYTDKEVNDIFNMTGTKNADELVLIQFKKKTPELMIGAKNTAKNTVTNTSTSKTSYKNAVAGAKEWNTVTKKKN